MKRYLIPTGFLVLATAAPAAANHINNSAGPFASRGACESYAAGLDNDDRSFLQQVFPDLFGSSGTARSFIGRAFTCERDGASGDWYLEDHRVDVLSSDWWAKRIN